MYKSWKRVAMVSTMLALSSVIVFAGAAFAQGNGPGNRAARANPAAPANAQANRFGRGDGGMGQGYGLAVQGAWAGRDQSLVATAAEVLDLDQADLVAELQAGQTLAEVAEANEVDVQEIVDAFLAPRADVLAAAVADGKITQADADAMEARMQAMVSAKAAQAWEPRGHGNGTGAPGQGMGANRVDEDGDGVCDNCDGTHQTMRTGRQQSMGRGMAAHGGRMHR